MAEQEHDKTTLLGLQRALALQQVEVDRAEALPAQEEKRYAEHQAHVLAEHEKILVDIQARRQQALAERERIAEQVAEVAARIGT